MQEIYFSIQFLASLVEIAYGQIFEKVSKLTLKLISRKTTQHSGEIFCSPNFPHFLKMTFKLDNRKSFNAELNLPALKKYCESETFSG